MRGRLTRSTTQQTQQTHHTSSALRLVSILAAAALATGMAACTIDTSARETNGNNQTQNQAQDQAQSAEPKPPAVSVKDGATGVNPADRVVVKSLGEGLTKVTMTNEAGKQVEGKLAEDKRSWSTAEDLGFNRTYKVVAVDVNGETSTVSFSTVAPAATSFASLAPLDGATVGVAQVIALRFDTAIKNRQEVQDAIKVTTTPEVEGAFHWVSNQEVRWRPAQFWQPGTRVTVEADLYGLNLGGGVYGENDNGASFTIGDRVEAIADDATKQMVILKNGETVKTMPISMGTDRWATPNGVYTIGDEYETLLMDSTTYGLALDAGGYQTNVKYATQMSYSGIFVHAAPWSEWAQGSSNQSHGCINVSTENARWFQEFFKRGDIVTVKNTVGGTLSPYDGLGDWNMDWATWKAGNADT